MEKIETLIYLFVLQLAPAASLLCSLGTPSHILELKIHSFYLGRGSDGFLIWRKYQYFVENVQYTDWHSPHLSSSSRTVRLINIKKSTPDTTPYVLCFCFSLFRSASLMCSVTAMKNKGPFLGEMSVRNGFKKKRSMRRADSTYITSVIAL